MHQNTISVQWIVQILLLVQPEEQPVEFLIITPETGKHFGLYTLFYEGRTKFIFHIYHTDQRHELTYSGVENLIFLVLVVLKKMELPQLFSVEN